MASKSEVAAEYFASGLNCAQSTLKVFAEDYGLNDEIAMRMATALGGGCHYGGLCGAVLGGSTVVGLKHGTPVPNPDAYGFCRGKTREFIEKFLEQNGSIDCRDLIGIDFAEPDGRARAMEQNLTKTLCPKFVISAVQILEDLGY